MKQLNFIETAQHNRKSQNKGLRNMMVLSLLCAVPAAISRLFFWQHTREAMVRVKGMWVQTEIGWPATVFGYGSFFAVAFALFYVYLRFKHDLNQPSFGVTNDGIFINQQVLRNAFVAWHNIQKAELLGPAESPFMRLMFKDYADLVKGQPFLLKSVAKANFKNAPVLSITKVETIGDIRKMQEIIHNKIPPRFNGNMGEPDTVEGYIEKYGVDPRTAKAPK